MLGSKGLWESQTEVHRINWVFKVGKSALLTGDGEGTIKRC